MREPIHRRDFLATLGAGVARDLGLSSAWAADEPGRVTFGDLEPLVAFMQETPPEKFLAAAVEKMQSVAEGTLLGRVTDPFGNVLHEVRAPFAGEVLYVVGTPPVTEGEPLAFVGQVAENEPKP